MKRPGRPRVAPNEETVQTSVRMSAKQFDATQRQAAADRLTMADWIRQILAAGISHTKNSK